MLPLSSLRCAAAERPFVTAFQRNRVKHRQHGLLLAALMLAAAGNASTARADIWGFVDASGRSHLASEKLDSRYQLFFKGATRVGAPAGKAETSPAAPSPETIAEAKAADNFRNSAQFIRTTSQPNVKRFEPIIEKAAKVHKIDPALVKAVVAVESSFQPDAVSPKGALGLMQVIPDTAERYGITGDRKKSTGQKLLDPAINLKVGIEHLSNLMSMFGSKLELVLAAYNAGEGNVLKYAMKIPPFPETQEYVKLVKQFYAGFKPASKKQQHTVVTQLAATTPSTKWSAATTAPAVVVPMSMVAAAATPVGAIPAAGETAAQPTPAVATTQPASSADGVIRDGVIRDGVIRDGVIRDGVIRDGIIRDGIIRTASPAAASGATVAPTAASGATTQPAAPSPATASAAVASPATASPATASPAAQTTSPAATHQQSTPATDNAETKSAPTAETAETRIEPVPTPAVG